MTQWFHTIGRQVTNTMPAWRSAMTSANTAYLIGETPSSVLPGRIVWPAGSTNNTLFVNGVDNNALYMTEGYGGSIFVPEIGAYGAMIFTTTGEHCLSNQMTSFGISEDNPSWNFYQQPLYAVTAGQATTMNADLYFDDGTVSPVTTWSYGSPDSGSFNGFPARFTCPSGTWLFKRAYTSGLLGDGRPWWLRYDMPCYIPASMTGTGVGAIVVTGSGTIYGPFNQGPVGPGASAAQMYSESWPGSGRAKQWFHAMNVQTKAWTRCPTAAPDYQQYGGVISMPYSGVDVERKRIYYLCIPQGTQSSIYYADFTGGLAGQTISGAPAPITNGNAVGTSMAVDSNNSIFCVLTTGVNAGKRLWYTRESGGSNLLVIDVDANSVNRLSIGMPGGEWGLAFDPVTNIIYTTIVNKAGNSIVYYKFTIPTSYTSAGSYTLTGPTSISMGAITLENGNYTQHRYGQQNMIHPQLGTIMVAQGTNRMVAFRPA